MYRAIIDLDGETHAGLPADEAHHLTRVRRAREGQEFLGFDEKSETWYRCRLSRSKGVWGADLIGSLENNLESPLKCWLAQSLLKKDKFEWVIQKSVELGVSEIIPLETWRSEKQLKDHNRSRILARWRKIAVEAVKQCGRSQIPKVWEPVELERFLRTDSLPAVRFFLDEAGGKGLTEVASSVRQTDSCLCVVGPEGGWDDKDRTIFNRYSMPAVQLGSRILRAETAPLATLSILQFVVGDLG